MSDMDRWNERARKAREICDTLGEELDLYSAVIMLRDKLEALEERYSWAIQLCDDNNMPPWKERYEAEIDKAIREDRDDQ